jgi:AraC-like DNA-binding protein
MARANEPSHLRSVLVQIGKQGLARNAAYNNRALGIERSSRIGTKRSLPGEAIRTFRERMERLGRPGIGATLEPQRALSRREAAAIRAAQTQAPVATGFGDRERICRSFRRTFGQTPRAIRNASSPLASI